MKKCNVYLYNNLTKLEMNNKQKSTIKDLSNYPRIEDLSKYPISLINGIMIQTCPRQSSNEGEKLGYRTGKLVGISSVKGAEIYFTEENWVENHELYQIKPILRPLSDLIKEIEIGGEKFIPIERLFGLLGEWCYTDFKGDIDSCYKKFGIDSDSNHWICFETSYEEICFWFGHNSFRLSIDQECQHVDNQLELFNKLYEWHFDVNGLIDSGLAVDINTLNEKQQ